MAESILDASAFLAYLHGEPGADAVTEAIAEGTAMSTVNLAEVLSRVADRGGDPVRVAEKLSDEGLLHGAIWIEELTHEDAVEVARLRLLTRDAGLSLADRSCLVLALRLDLPTLTADSAWSQIDVGVEIRMIR